MLICTTVETAFKTMILVTLTENRCAGYRTTVNNQIRSSLFIDYAAPRDSDKLYQSFSKLDIVHDTDDHSRQHPCWLRGS
jgi:hypothetical protein